MIINIIRLNKEEKKRNKEETNKKKELSGWFRLTILTKGHVPRYKDTILSFLRKTI